tara:strand:- start:45 stop:566 length:522 start_codon:yes stop_codon:yes gene_type:complete
MNLKKTGKKSNGLTPGGKSNRSMTNLATQAINKKPAQYTDSGQNFKDANNNMIKGSQVDEGELSPVIRKSPMRPFVVGSKDSMYPGENLYLSNKPLQIRSSTRGQMAQGVKDIKSTKMQRQSSMKSIPEKRMQSSMKSIPKKRMQASMKGEKLAPAKMQSGSMKREVRDIKRK